MIHKAKIDPLRSASKATLAKEHTSSSAIPQGPPNLLVESGIQGFGIQNRAQVIRNPTKEQDPKSKTVLDSLTWGDRTGLQTANYYFSFIYHPLIRNPHFQTNWKTFVREISVRRFLPCIECFFLSRVVKFSFHAPRDSLESKATFVSQPVNKEVGLANNKVSTLILNRATSVKVRK